MGELCLFGILMKNKLDIPERIPEWLHDEYLKWMENKKRYESLYSVSASIIKKYLESEDTNEKSKKRPHK